MAGCGYYCTIYKNYEGNEGSGSFLGYSEPETLYWQNAPITFTVSLTETGFRELLVLGGPYDSLGEAKTYCPNDPSIIRCHSYSESGSVSALIVPSDYIIIFPDDSESGSASPSYSPSYSPSMSPSMSTSTSQSVSYSYSSSFSESTSGSQSGSASAS